MKKTSSELKSMAKEALLGRYSLPIGAYIITLAISFAVNLIISTAFRGRSIIVISLYFAATLIVSLLLNILSAGISYMILNLTRNKEYRLNHLFFAFTHQPDRIILLGLLLSLIGIGCMTPGTIIIILGSLANALFIELLGILFMIIGFIVIVILTLSYSQIFFIYLDDPHKSVR